MPKFTDSNSRPIHVPKGLLSLIYWIKYDEDLRDDFQADRDQVMDVFELTPAQKTILGNLFLTPVPMDFSELDEFTQALIQDVQEDPPTWW